MRGDIPRESPPGEGGLNVERSDASAEWTIVKRRLLEVQIVDNELLERAGFKLLNQRFTEDVDTK